MPVSDEEILWGYRIVLGRDPESRFAYDSHAGCSDLQELCRVLFNSAEFADNNRYSTAISVKRKPFGGLPADSRFVSHTKQRMLVVSGCQAEPFAKQLQSLTGGSVQSRFVSEEKLNAYSAGVDALPEEWRSFDMVLTQKSDLYHRVQASWPEEYWKWTLLPLVTFDGFHPDMCYLQHRPTQSQIVGPMGTYHSVIVTAAYLANIPAEKTAQLFCAHVFLALRYQERVASAVEKLLQDSSSTAMPLDALIDSWNKGGRWMWTFNHPRLHILADMARQFLTQSGISFEAGAEHHVRDDLLELGDWPAYFNGSAVIDPGSYRFRPPASLLPDARGVYFMNLEAFITSSYRALSDLRSEDIRAVGLNGDIELEPVMRLLIACA